MSTNKLSGKPDETLGVYLRWTSIPSRGSSNTPSRFMLPKSVISSGSYARQARDLTIGLRRSSIVFQHIWKHSLEYLTNHGLGYNFL